MRKSNQFPSGGISSLSLAAEIADAKTFTDLGYLRQLFLTATEIKPEERHQLESALAHRERELIEFYTCRL